MGCGGLCQPLSSYSLLCVLSSFVAYLVMAEGGKKPLKFRPSKVNSSTITDGTPIKL